jgi:hypothetical protein
MVSGIDRMPELFDMYQALWRIVEELGASVFYDGCLEDGSGTFHPDPNETGGPSPAIGIGRPYYSEADGPTRFRNAGGNALPPPDLLSEVVTLAHEAGHFLSWRDTQLSGWQTYFDAAQARDQILSQVPKHGTVEEYNERLRGAVQAALRPEQIQSILAEEATAWAIGRELLERVGFENSDYYANRKRRGLHVHRYRLGLDDLWPEDAAPQNTAD